MKNTLPILAAALLSTLIFFGCGKMNYKEEIFSLVNENQSLLTEHLSQTDTTVSDELSALGIQRIGTDGDIIFFEMYYTGLFDGGVEYGFYYTEGTSAFIKNASTNDFMVTTKIADNWYYYEWHNG